MTAPPDISPPEPSAELLAGSRPRPPERDRDDPLLAALAHLTGLIGEPISADALASGMPLHDNRMTPELALRAARRAGFAAKLVRRQRLAAISPLNLPCLLAMRDGGACVLVKLAADGTAEIVLAETGGMARVAVAELEPRFAGLVLLLSPGYAPDARADSAPASRARGWFWGALTGLWPIYGHVAVAALAVNLLGLAGSIYTMNVYDRVVPNNATETLWVLTIGVMIAYGFDFLLRTVRAYFVDAAGRGADAVLAARLFEQVMGMRLEARPASTGALASNLREYESLREFFTSATLVTLVDLPFVFVYVVVAWLIAGHVALVPLLALPLVIAVGLVLQVPLRRAVERNQAEAAQKHAILVELIEGIETLKVAGAEGRAQRLWERFVAAAARSSMTGRVIANLAVNFTVLATNVASVSVILVGVSEIAAGHLTMGALIAATILTGRAMTPLGQIATLIVRVNQSMVALKALDRLMQAPRERVPGASYVSRPNLRGQIEFSDIHFAYPAGGAPGAAVPALRGVSLFVGAGERVGIVGRIGSGKSTLARLIAGLYLPQQGSILIDGTDLRQIDPTELRRQMGYVPQDAFLVFGSVRDNITVAWPHADDEAVLRAATIAGVDDFVKARPQGYDLQVGERGQYLSGGQRAAVTIARALLFDPPILLLDEPTGAMDNTSEQRFRQRLEQILPGKTLVLVTHRGSMLALVDRLVVVDQGRVVADGPKQKVLEDLAAGTIRAAVGKGGVVKAVVDPDFAPEGHPESRRDVLRFAWIVSASVVLFFVAFFWWSSQAYLDEVTRGDGRVIPSQRVQVVQNLEGGIVSEILVTDGQIVERDAVVVRIANITAEADLQGSRAQSNTLRAAVARLEAESRGDSIAFPQDLLQDAPQVAESERALMVSRRQQLDSQLAVIRDQQAQRRSEITELRSKIAGLARTLDLTRQELRIIEPLVAQGAAARIDLVRIQGRISDMQGQLENAQLAIPRAESALAESQKRIDERVATFRSDANVELNQKRGQLSALVEKISADRDRVTRTEVRSPVRGTIKELKVSTVGGVIRPGQDIVEIVPLEDRLLIEAQLRPADIAFVRPGQPATIKITAYDYSIYGGLSAELEQISADTIQDERGERWFRVRLRTDRGWLGTAENPLPIIPGMTASVEILTGRKSVLDYLLKPIFKARDRALRER